MAQGPRPSVELGQWFITNNNPIARCRLYRYRPSEFLQFSAVLGHVRSQTYLGPVHAFDQTQSHVSILIPSVPTTKLSRRERVDGQPQLFWCIIWRATDSRNEPIPVVFADQIPTEEVEAWHEAGWTCYFRRYFDASLVPRFGAIPLQWKRRWIAAGNITRLDAEVDQYEIPVQRVLEFVDSNLNEFLLCMEENHHHGQDRKRVSVLVFPGTPIFQLYVSDNFQRHYWRWIIVGLEGWQAYRHILPIIQDAVVAAVYAS